MTEHAPAAASAATARFIELFEEIAVHAAAEPVSTGMALMMIGMHRPEAVPHGMEKGMVSAHGVTPVIVEM
jgi:hypothetical protein